MFRALLLTLAITLILPSCRSRQDADPTDSAAGTVTLASEATGSTARADTVPKAPADNVPKTPADNVPKASADNVPKASADNGPKASADNGPREAPADAVPAAPARTARTRADTGMVPPTVMGKRVSQSMESMEAHMRVMDTASAATLQASLPKHRQMAENMISVMNEEVRSRNIATDAIWPATVDSVRQDLSRLTAGTNVKAVMTPHLVRMRWLIQMHQTMTGKTPPEAAPPVSARRT